MAFTMIFICFHGVRALAGGHIVARATAGANAAPYAPNGDFTVTTLGSSQFAGMGGMVRRGGARGGRKRARCVNSLLMCPPRARR